MSALRKPVDVAAALYAVDLPSSPRRAAAVGIVERDHEIAAWLDGIRDVPRWVIAELRGLSPFDAQPELSAEEAAAETSRRAIVALASAIASGPMGQGLVASRMAGAGQPRQVDTTVTTDNVVLCRCSPATVRAVSPDRCACDGAFFREAIAAETPALPGEAWRGIDGDGDHIGIDADGACLILNEGSWLLVRGVVFREHVYRLAFAAERARADRAEAAVVAFQRASGCADGPALAVVLRERTLAGSRRGGA